MQLLIQRRSITITTAVVALSFLVAFPILASRAGYQYSSIVTKRIALAYAGDVVTRTDRIYELIGDVVDALKASGESDPCSAKQIALMRLLALRSPNVHLIGYIEDDRLECTSLGKLDPPIPVGPPRAIAAGKWFCRPPMELPFAPGARFLVVGQGGIALFISPTDSIDIAAGEPGVALATFSRPTRTIHASRGSVREAWLAAPGPYPSVFLDDGYAVAVAYSARIPIGAVAAIPLSAMAAQEATIARTATGVGFALGALFAGLFLYSARKSNSFPSILKQALRDRELFLVYQPILDLKTNRWVGAEALLRWRRPDGSAVAPDLFIPLIEEAKMMPMVTDHVLVLAVEDLRRIVPELPDFWLSINLSGEDIESADILQRLRALAAASDHRTANLHFEVTERKLLNAEIAGEVMNQIAALGYEVAIDDFGTGYSNISYLTDINFGCLKIDKSFIQAIGVDAATSHVAYHIIAMAKSLRLKIIAEGVETKDQLKFLTEHGVDFAQGFLISRPIALDELIAGAKLL